MRTGSGSMGGPPDSFVIGIFSIALDSDGRENYLNDGDVVVITRYSYESPKLLPIQFRNGGALIVYGERESGSPDPVGPIHSNLREAIDDMRNRRRIRRRMMTPVESPEIGSVLWEVRVMIALYDRPMSPFHSHTLLGVNSAGVISTLSIMSLDDATATPQELINTEMLVTDMLQSSMFNNKLICGHSGEADLLSIIHIGDSPGIHYSIPQINSSVNHIMHRGIKNPFGTSIYMFVVYNSATQPTSSGIYYIDYPFESTEFPIELMKSDIDLRNDQSIVNDIMLFPDQGYMTIIGTDKSDSESPTDFYFKAQVMCYRTCTTCSGIGMDQCTACPEGVELEIVSEDKGTCAEIDLGLTENDVIADCGGIEIPRCGRCEADQPGFCQSCQRGAGLDELTDRGTGASCVECPVQNCMSCEITPKGRTCQRCMPGFKLETEEDGAQVCSYLEIQKVIATVFIFLIGYLNTLSF